MGGPQPVSVSGATYLKIGNQADGGYNPWGPWNHEDMDVDDFALALIRCDSGATLSLECSWALNIVDDEYHRIWVAGDRAGAEVILGRSEESTDRRIRLLGRPRSPQLPVRSVAPPRGHRRLRPRRA